MQWATGESGFKRRQLRRVASALHFLYFSGEVMSGHDKFYEINAKGWIDTTKKRIRCNSAFGRETGEKDGATRNVVSSGVGLLENGRRLLLGCMKGELWAMLLLLRTTAMLIQRGGKWEGDAWEEIPPAQIVEAIPNRSMPLQDRCVSYGYSNSRPHYTNEETVGYTSGKIISSVQFRTGTEWNFHFSEERGGGNDNCLAYRKKCRLIGEGPSSWFVRSGSSAWVSEPTLNATPRGKTGVETMQQQQPHSEEPHVVNSTGGDVVVVKEGHILRRMWPMYCCCMLDYASYGIAAPMLPFFILKLGASVRHLSIIISALSLTHTIGSVYMISLSDRVGRKPILVCCLIASAISNFLLSRSKGLASVVCVQVVGGLVCGSKPVATATVADIVPIKLHPKFIGWLQASTGLGFIFGPLLVTALKTVKHISTRQIFRFASMFPLVALFFAIFSFKETKDHAKCIRSIIMTESVGEIDEPTTAAASLTVETSIDDQCNTKRQHFPLPVLLLVLNGFLLMFACSTETAVYATFIRDNFGHGETVLSIIFALNGTMIGILQLVFIKHIVEKMGKHMMLLMGDLVMSLGMVGFSLVQSQFLHFLLFGVHILGYSIADTAIVSLISRYSPPGTQGRSLGLNQASVGFARVITPLIAGVLYERSKTQGALPIGVLAFQVGSFAPFLAMAIPIILYNRLTKGKGAAQNVYKPPRAVSK